MGSNDAKEMLEVAQEECIRLERALALAERHSDRDRADMLLIAGQRDNALAVIEQALRAYEHWNWNDFPTKADEEHFIQVKRILARSPASALDEVRAEAWVRGYTSGHSRAMRHMSDEPGLPDGVNPYRTETP